MSHIRNRRRPFQGRRIDVEFRSLGDHFELSTLCAHDRAESDDDDDDMFHSYLLAGVRFDGSHHKLLCTETIFQ